MSWQKSGYNVWELYGQIVSQIFQCQMKKKGRGNYEQRVTSLSGVEVRAVKYFDKRPVMFETTYASVEPIIEKLKYDSKQRKKIPVPTIASLYNKHMGGVDRLDHLIALYRRVIPVRKSSITKFFTI